MVVFAGEAGADGQSLAAAIWFLFCAAKLWEEPNAKWVFWTTATGGVSALTKLPFFMAAGLGWFFMTLAGYRKQYRSRVFLGIAAAVIMVGLLAWTQYANRLYAQAELPFVDLRPEASQMSFWYFGDLNYRRSPGVWGKGGWWFMTVFCGSFALLTLLALAFLRAKASRLGRYWLLGAGLTTLVFFHLVPHHAHYYLMFSPAVAMLLAWLAMELGPTLLGLAPGRRLLMRFAMVLGLALATVQGMEGLRLILKYDN